jgi:hypothetical protein
MYAVCYGDDARDGVHGARDGVHGGEIHARSQYCQTGHCVDYWTTFFVFYVNNKTFVVHNINTDKI